MIKPIRTPEWYAFTDPDVRLMLRVRDGDEAAFEELTKRQTARIRAIFSRHLISASQIEELTQEVFLRVYRARQNYVPTAKFCTWLATIANNLLSNLKLKESRRHKAFGQSTSMVDGCVANQKTPLDLLEESERREIMNNAVAQLNDRQRTAIRLNWFRNLCYSDVATEMKLSPEAVKSLLYRARRSLREILDASKDELLLSD